MYCRLRFDIDLSTLIWAAAGQPVSRRRLASARSMIGSYWSGRSAALAFSARTALDALLSEVSAPRGSRILMSGINIEGVADILSAHGLEMVVVDIDPQTLAPRPGALTAAQASSGARLCLVAQLFGSVTAIADAAALKERGVFVIEDAAQAFAGRQYAGDPNADASLFSFGPIKRNTALGGGAIVCQDANLASRIAGRLEALKQRSDLWFRVRASKYIVLKLLSTPAVYRWVIAAIGALGRDPDAVLGGVARGFAKGPLLAAVRRAPPDRMILLMARQLKRFAEDRHRVAACESFIRSLPGEAIGVGAAVDRHAYWLLPIRSADPEALVRRCRASGFDATRGATSLRALAGERTPSASSLLQQIVYLPHPAFFSDKARLDLVAAVAASVDATG